MFKIIRPKGVYVAQVGFSRECTVTVTCEATGAIGGAPRQSRGLVSIGVNEHDVGTVYNTQLLSYADGGRVQHRRKLSPHLLINGR